MKRRLINTITRRSESQFASERGASSVEFALVLIPFLTLVFGIIYFGIVFGQQLALGNGARQGARLAVVKNSCTDIRKEVQNASYSVGLTTTDIDVTVQRKALDGSVVSTPCAKSKTSTAADSTTFPCAGSSTGDSLYVLANYRSTVSLPIFSPKIGLTGEGEFRCEYSS